MNAERPRRVIDEGAGIGRAAEHIVRDDDDLFGVRRDHYGRPTGEFVMPADDVAPTVSTAVDTGSRRRDTGHKRAASTVEGTLWLTGARSWIEARPAGRRFTAEDMREQAGEPPEANLVGVAVKLAQLEGLIECVGAVTANRPEAHSRLLREWARR